MRYMLPSDCFLLLLFLVWQPTATSSLSFWWTSSSRLTAGIWWETRRSSTYTFSLGPSEKAFGGTLETLRQYWVFSQLFCDCSSPDCFAVYLLLNLLFIYFSSMFFSKSCFVVWCVIGSVPQYVHVWTVIKLTTPCNNNCDRIWAKRIFSCFPPNRSWQMAGSQWRIWRQPRCWPLLGWSLWREDGHERRRFMHSDNHHKPGQHQ